MSVIVPPTPSSFRCSAFSTNATFSLPASSNTTIPLNSHDFDIGGLHDDVTNNSRLTIPVGGTGQWLFYYYAFLSGVSGTITKQAFLNKNGSFLGLNVLFNYDTGGQNTILTASGVIAVSAGDYVELVLNHTNASAMTVGSASRAFQTTLVAVKL